MVKNCVDYKQPRMNAIKVIEDMLAYKLQPALKGRINVPFDGVLMNSFIKTLCAQSNRPPTVKFEDKKGSNFEGVQKTQAFWDEDSGYAKMNLKKKDRWSKRLCAISNLGIFEVHAESDPKYKSYLTNIDLYDFIFDPTGGSDIEDHMYVGRTNIFKTDEDLKSEMYDKKQVALLKANTNSSDFKKNEDLYQNKVTRYATQGLSIETNNYVGQNLYNLTELELSINSKRYLITFDYSTGTWVRFEELKDVFESGLYSYCTWQGIEDPFNLLNPGLADMAAVIFEAIRLNLNEVLNNNRKRNWDMKAVDSEMFPDISALDWKQDGIVPAKLKMNQSIQNGIYRFETPEISGALNLNQVLNNFIGINSGVTDQSKGETSQSTLGQSQLDEINISKGMKLLGDSYSECLAQIVLRWDWNQYEHLDDDYAIKILGKDGMELTHFGKKDSEPDYDVCIITDDDKLQEEKRDIERQSLAINNIVANPLLLQEVPNKKALVEEIFKNAGFSSDAVRQLMSADDYVDYQTSQANKGIESILLGKEWDEIPDATPGTLNIIDIYIRKNTKKLDQETLTKLQTFFDQTAKYVEENAQRKPGPAPKEQPAQPLPANPMTSNAGNTTPQGLGGPQI
jgi:hypothetical protein